MRRLRRRGAFRDHGSDGEYPDDGVAPRLAQHGGRDDAHAPEQRQQHLHLEGQAEGEDQRHHEIEIVADLGHQFDAERALAALGLETEEEADGERQHHIEDKARAGDEQHRAGDQERQKGFAFFSVEAGGHEQPDLRGNARKENGRGTDGPLVMG